MQVARQGYAVWCDVTKLLGGESFWADIEEAIRKYTIKFLFVLSRSSNNPKRGTIDELLLATDVGKKEAFRDFIIPIRLDDIPFAERFVAMQQLYVIDFHGGWADGLAKLFTKFEKDAVPRDCDRFNPSSVSSWWKAHCDGQEIVRNVREEYLSNWFPVDRLPELIHVHVPKDPKSARGQPRYPAYFTSNCAVSFATAADLGLQDATTSSVSTKNLLAQDQPGFPITSRSAKYAATNILRQAWERFLRGLGLRVHPLANERKCFYFTQELLLGKKRVSFEIPGLLSGQRNLVGTYKGHSWHLGLSGDVNFEPILAYVVRQHVLFSDDGKTIWTSTGRLHSARRSACKDWWNHHWRDRLLASLDWIAKRYASSQLVLPVSASESLLVSTVPVLFDSPVGYEETAVCNNPFLEEDRNEYEDEPPEEEAKEP